MHNHIIVTLVLLLHLLSANLSFAKDTAPYVYVESEVRQRLTQMDLPVTVRFNRTVRAYIKSYIKRKRNNSEVILGRASIYFPIFEQMLKEKGLPEALKFLPVLESALNPHAVSRSGAVGLWQFMPKTAKGFQLEINSYVDERKDPYKATRAAVKYLDQLYRRFGDWNLVLIAYNCGPTKVAKTIRKAKTRKFSKLIKLLPKETQHYVSAYIAASYLMKFYQYHDLNPQYPDYDLQFTETIMVRQYTSFNKISMVSGIPLETIERLNPTYNNGAMPFKATGNYLTLPVCGMSAYREYFDKAREEETSYNNAYYDQNKSMAMLAHWVGEIYIVEDGDTLEVIAERFETDVANLRVINQLENTNLEEGQELLVYINNKKEE